MATWRVFSSAPDAHAYNAACFAALVRVRAAEMPDGKLDDHRTSPPAPTTIDGLPDSALTPVRFPLYGRRNGVWNREYGWVTAWGSVHVTAAGLFAVQAFDPTDPLAVAEPLWPDDGAPT